GQRQQQALRLSAGARRGQRQRAFIAGQHLAAAHIDGAHLRDRLKKRHNFFVNKLAQRACFGAIAFDERRKIGGGGGDSLGVQRLPQRGRKLKEEVGVLFSQVDEHVSREVGKQAVGKGLGIFAVRRLDAAV